MALTKKSTPAAATKAAKAPTGARTSPAKPAAAVKSPAEMKAAAALESAAANARAAQQRQMDQWERGVTLFSKKNFAQAKAAFDEAAGGPAAHIADKARSYAQVCARRTEGDGVRLQSSEDHFNYGVERLNARDMDTARQHLEKALSLEPEAEHILFTLALCCGIAGDGAAAYDNLKRAIAIEPKNRILARQDPEFLVLAQQLPVLRPLLTPERAD